MTTPRHHALVSLFAILALGACTTRTIGPAALDAPAPDSSPAASPRPSRLTLRVDNQGRERIHVYLLGERRDWLLGPVEPGAIALLTVPARALTESRGNVRLAAIPGGHLTMQAGRDARAVVALGQPAGTLPGQRWVFAQGQLTPLQLR